MDQLAIALSKAIDAGTQFAYPALIGYFIVKFFTDFLVYPLCWTIVAWTVIRGVKMLVDGINEEGRERRKERNSR